MISVLFLLLIYIGFVAILQFKKSKQPGSKIAKKIAFFHPFWYGLIKAAMMEGEEKKFYGL